MSSVNLTEGIWLNLCDLRRDYYEYILGLSFFFQKNVLNHYEQGKPGLKESNWNFVSSGEATWYILYIYVFFLFFGEMYYNIMSRVNPD